MIDRARRSKRGGPIVARPRYHQSVTARRSGSSSPGAATRGPGKRASVEAQLAVLEATATDASSAEAHARLREALQTGSGLVAARAAKIVREHAFKGFDDDLIAMLLRLRADPVKNDPGCLGNWPLLRRWTSSATTMPRSFSSRRGPFSRSLRGDRVPRSRLPRTTMIVKITRNAGTSQ